MGGEIMKKILKFFSLTEWIILSISLIIITTSFMIFDRTNYFTLISSIIGIVSVLLCAKGNVVGIVLGITFSVFYAIISCSMRYYGEMLTYLLLTLPMEVISLISWIRHPSKESKMEVQVSSIRAKDIIIMFILAAITTFIFYFILKYLGTENIVPSTISIATSFCAVFLTHKRSPFYCLAYATNDLVLIILWALACIKDISYLSVVICFGAFLINDIYGFINWNRIKKRQRN